MFWYYGVKTHFLSEVCSVWDALPGGQLKNCMFPDLLLSSLRCRMQWCLTIVVKVLGRRLLVYRKLFSDSNLPPPQSVWPLLLWLKRNLSVFYPFTWPLQLISGSLLHRGIKVKQERKCCGRPDRNFPHAWLSWAFPRSPHVEPLT